MKQLAGNPGAFPASKQRASPLPRPTPEGGKPQKGRNGRRRKRKKERKWEKIRTCPKGGVNAARINKLLVSAWFLGNGTVFEDDDLIYGEKRVKT
jgi:hypothetical protein